MVPKAPPADFISRFREIISDPLNILIERDEWAGTVSGGKVTLHNGNRVALQGPMAYYGNFATVLTLNRGVHEPMEEYIFQEVLRRMGPKPVMIELGAYWSHYSMWLKAVRPDATNFMVEPDANNIEVGKENFRLNEYEGEFIQAFVDKGQFEIDPFVKSREIEKLDILHADIQGFEVQMLDGARETLTAHKADYVFVSTHSQALHRAVRAMLEGYGYRVEANSDFEDETTSYDGLVFATAPHVAPLFDDGHFLHRKDINGADPAILVEMLQRRLADQKREAAKAA